MALIRHKTTLVEVSVPDAEAALPYFPDHEVVPSEEPDTSSGEESTAKTTRRSNS